MSTICLKEYCADEIHLATMGLADNHNAVVDVICSADDALLQQISVFYGEKEKMYLLFISFCFNAKVSSLAMESMRSSLRMEKVTSPSC